MDTYLNCLMQLEDQGVKTVIDIQGRELPIECAIEEQLKWVNDSAKEYCVEGNRILRCIRVFVAGEVA